MSGKVFLQGDRPELVDEAFNILSVLISWGMDLDWLKETRGLELRVNEVWIKIIWLLLFVWLDTLDKVGLWIEQFTH